MIKMIQISEYIRFQEMGREVVRPGFNLPQLAQPSQQTRTELFEDNPVYQ